MTASVFLSRSADAAEYNYFVRRNAHLEEVNDYQRDRLDALEQRVQRLDHGLTETTRVLMELRDAVETRSRVGIRCARCGDAGVVTVGSGAGDDPVEEVLCPVCQTGQKEPGGRDDDA